jgi:signal transduction histidine kinase
MFHYEVAQLINTVVLLSLGIFVFIWNTKNEINRTFALHALAGSIWAFSFYKMTAAVTPADGLFWARALHVGACLIPAFFLHFNLAVLEKSHAQRKLITTAYVISAILLLLIPTPFLVSHTVAVVGFKYFVGPAGWYYHFFPIYFTSCILYGLYQLYRGYRTATGMKRIQLKYLIVASLIGYSGGPGGFFPLYRVPIPYYAFYAVALYIGIIAYSIVRFRLFDIEVVLKKAYFYFSLATVSAVLITASAYCLKLIFRETLPLSVVVVMFLTSFFASIIVVRLRDFIERSAARLIRNSRYTLEYANLEALSNEIRGIMQSDKLLAILAQAFFTYLHLEHAGAYWLDPARHAYTLADKIGTAKHALPEILETNNPLIVHLAASLRILETDQEDYTDPVAFRKLSRVLREELDAALVLPLGDKNLLGFIVLGRIFNRPGFSERELKLLEAIGAQASLMLENIQLYEKISHENRLEVIGTIATSIAHEIHNPLTSINSLIQLLPAHAHDPQFVEKVVKIVPGEIARITEISKQLLNFSKANEVNKQTTNLSELVDKVGDLLGDKLLQAQVTLAKEMNMPGKIQVDENQIMQVLINLVLNAVQASNPEGTITIRTEPSSLNETVPAVTVSVADNGQGIKKENLSNIFDPFFSTKIYGTGLGLPTCKRIIELHAGTLCVQSEEGKGSTFTMVLPVGAGAAG